eukprot:gnl/TRDRNA2_/TRDRNA2_134077_c0_seq1.p1 gnl/TRDRNA2_/TRDRNA2_134077_c0~~gnl/TRDRNA2_/TRDRNA2_134077_c0_seq1.p1  ORF type:complete len:156 (+),score=26.26 gnl/TRDRNA2_/TRDRNA2_134077_c0_seq1:27-470(+)
MWSYEDDKVADAFQDFLSNLGDEMIPGVPKKKESFLYRWANFSHRDQPVMVLGETDLERTERDTKPSEAQNEDWERYRCEMRPSSWVFDDVNPVELPPVYYAVPSLNSYPSIVPGFKVVCHCGVMDKIHEEERWIYDAEPDLSDGAA